MLGSGKSVRPVRQLSLQPPAAPRRQQIRRQRSAEDDKPLQICASPLARGKRGKSAKPGSERPKVRVAWSEDRRKNEKELEQVEVVARQIPGRSRPITGKSRGLIGIEKPPILYSRQELAERLRLAWKHREENRANINIFLAHSTVEERCDSEMSSHATITVPSSPMSRDDVSNESELSATNDYEITLDEQIETSDICMRLDGNYLEKETEGGSVKKSMTVLTRNNGAYAAKKDGNEPLLNFKHTCAETERITSKNAGGVKEKEEEKTVTEQEKLNEEHSDVDEYCSASTKTSVRIDCSNSRVSSATLPSIKIENATLFNGKATKEDFSSAKQKRASFHSGTNKAFLEPIKSPTTEFRGSFVDKAVLQKQTTVETKDSAGTEKSVATKAVLEFRCSSIAETSAALKTNIDNKSSCAINKNARVKCTVEGREASTETKATTQKTGDGNKSCSTIRRNVSTSIIAENRDNSTVEKVGSTKNASEARCSSVNERNPPSKKPLEGQRIDQKSRRTNSAPPQRHLANASTNSNRVQVNIVIDAPTANTGRNEVRDDREKATDTTETIDTASTKISSGRLVRSAPLKKRSRSTKKRFWGACSYKTDEDGRSRTRSGGRGRNSIDSRPIDIVTMVSLVSSADSDSDIENSPGDDKLINELRSKLPTTSIIKTPLNPVPSISRKPIKSVSFQRNSFDEDSSKEQQPSPKEEKKTTTQARFAIVNNGGPSSGDETVSWRTDIPGLALPIMALIHDVEEATDVPLTDREKRCLAVPIGDLHDDNKRKLLKTRSTPSRYEMEKQAISPKTKVPESRRILPQKPEISSEQTKTPVDSSAANMKQTFAVPTPKVSEQLAQTITGEPQFQTNKEKECWHLYRRMCDKGVCVSFDTVLRGMLTPTEYRLRQKEVSQDL